MLRKIALSLFLALSLMPFRVPSSSAQELRLPVTGNPAFVLTLPAGWTSLLDEWGNLRLTHESRTALIQLSMVTGEDARASYSDLATGILKEAGAEPYSMNGQGAIAGVPGQAFLSKITNANGVTLDLVVTLARLDQDHIAGLVTMKVVGLSSEAIAAVNDVAAKVSFTGMQ